MTDERDARLSSSLLSRRNRRSWDRDERDLSRSRDFGEPRAEGNFMRKGKSTLDRSERARTMIVRPDLMILPCRATRPRLAEERGG